MEMEAPFDGLLLALIFTLHLGTASISYFLTAATKFSCISSNEINVSFVSSSRSTSPPSPTRLSLLLSLSPFASVSKFSLTGPQQSGQNKCNQLRRT